MAAPTQLKLKFDAICHTPKIMQFRELRPSNATGT